VEDGVTGLLAIKADTASLTDKLRAVIDGEVDTQTLSRNARANIEKKYTQVKVTANNLNFYQSLLRSHGAS
jgi:glycosyltransferase involved in cell wall biosynthesis